jgi:DNA-binding XRE family transcriptional regulator
LQDVRSHRVELDAAYAAEQAATEQKKQADGDKQSFPEEHRWKLGKGFRPFHYTRQDVARAAGLTLAAVRKAEREKRLDVNDLWSVACWIARSRDRRSK